MLVRKRCLRICLIEVRVQEMLGYGVIGEAFEGKTDVFWLSCIMADYARDSCRSF